MATASENLNVLRSSNAPARDDLSVSGDQFTRELGGVGRVGRSGARQGHSRLFRYDRVQGAAKAELKFSTDQADRMSLAEAADYLQRIHRHYGIEAEPDAVQFLVDEAMFVAYAMNGGSQLAPHERIKFYVTVGDDVSEFEYTALHTILGVELRRFFRTYADPVVDACRRVLETLDPDDEDQVHLAMRMRALAADRGIPRYPWLIADCCDAASSSLNTAERAAVSRSKAMVIGATSNAVDQVTSHQNIRSQDGFDSSVGKDTRSGVPQSPQYYT